MATILKYVLVLFLAKCVNYAVSQRPHNASEAMFKLQEMNSSSNAGFPLMNGTLFQTVKRYHCAWKSLRNVSNSDLLLYGSKTWTFPNQNVQLDLSYPDYPTNSTGILISMFDVILRIGGTNSAGYITSGGILQNHISLSFIFYNVSALEYEFWLYGVPAWPEGQFHRSSHQFQELC